jgi:hypothetical protein
MLFSISMLGNPSSTNCNCQHSIAGQEEGDGSPTSAVWQEFGIFRQSPSTTPVVAIKKRSHDEEDNDCGTSITRPNPEKRQKKFQDISNTSQLLGWGSSTFSLSVIDDCHPNKNSISKQIATFLINEANHIRLKEERVRPHSLANDILSRIASTPFDSDEMRSFYRQNNWSDSSRLTAATNSTPEIMPLPIIPQNKFIKESSRRKLIAILNQDISKFLLGEAERMEEQLPLQNHFDSSNINTCPPPNDNTDEYVVSLQDASIANFGVMHDGSISFLGYQSDDVNVVKRMKPGDVIVNINGNGMNNLSDLLGAAAFEISQVTTKVSYLTCVDRESYNRRTAPKTVADAQTNYDASLRKSMRLQGLHHIAIRQKWSHEHRYNHNEKEASIKKLKQHFDVCEQLREMAWKDLKLKERQMKELEQLRRRPFATASDIIKASHAEASKLPVAFGFHLYDKASKASATAAATKWSKEGKEAVISMFTVKNDSANTTGTTRSSAKLLLTELMGSEEFPGWTKKTFERVSGNTTGTKDSYFYSPENQFKFRSIKGVKIFIGILSEPGVAGDESRALALYKQRGHKL